MGGIRERQREPFAVFLWVTPKTRGAGWGMVGLVSSRSGSIAVTIRGVMIRLILLILVSAITFSGAGRLWLLIINSRIGSVPVWVSSSFGWVLLKGYLILAIPISLMNGYLLHHSYLESLAAGVGMYLVSFVMNKIEINPAIKFILFGSVNLIWTVYLLAQWA